MNNNNHIHCPNCKCVVYTKMYDDRGYEKYECVDCATIYVMCELTMALRLLTGDAI